jgi:hypothetical protein
MKIASIGLLLAEFDPIKGPEALEIVPSILSREDQTTLAIKAMDLLYLESVREVDNFIIESPSLKMKALVSPYKWDDEKLRGGVGIGAIILFFEEHLDVIFYKYRADFGPIIKEYVTKIKEIREKHLEVNSKLLLEELYQKIQTLWNELSAQELDSNSFSDFPEDFENIKEPDASYKVLVLGDPMVGKTSTILRYTDNAFRQSYLVTIGVNLSIKNIYKNSKFLILTLWDIAGQAKFSKMRPIFYRGSDGALLVFDLTNRNSFLNIEKWYRFLL